MQEWRTQYSIKPLDILTFILAIQTSDWFGINKTKCSFAAVLTLY